ncbi:MAG: hypothetical protein ACR2JB_19635 [Bryobacteraceae bacterium]
MKIPLLDLKAQYAVIKDEILGAVAEVLESQVCIEAKEWIQNLKKSCGQSLTAASPALVLKASAV